MKNLVGMSPFHTHLNNHLGSTSLTTDKNGVKTSEMRYKPWGEVRSWWTSALATTPAYKLADYTFTGQYSYMDDLSTPATEGFGLMFYNARFYDPALGRFTSADTVVTGDKHKDARNIHDVADSMFTPLTVDYSEQPILDKLNKDNSFIQQHGGSLLEVSEKEVKKAKITGVPLEIQLFDRYSYTINNPMKYTDPTGYDSCGGVTGFSYCYYLGGEMISMNWNGSIVIFNLTELDPSDKDDAKVLFSINEFVKAADTFKLESENMLTAYLLGAGGSIATIGGIISCIPTLGWGCGLAAVGGAIVAGGSTKDIINTKNRRKAAMDAGSENFLFLLNVSSP